MIIWSESNWNTTTDVCERAVPAISIGDTITIDGEGETGHD